MENSTQPTAPDPQNQVPPPNLTGQPGQPLMPMASPPKKSNKLLIGLLVFLLILGGAAAAWTLKPDADNTPASSNNQTQSQEEATEEAEVEMTSTTFISGLEHKTTATFEHPAAWDVTTSETKPEGAETYSLKTMVVGSPANHYLHIYDRDGIGGYCDPDKESYTLYKEVTTKTSNMLFKDYSVPSSQFLNHVLLFETEGKYPDFAKRDALKEGESSTNTCDIGGYSTIGGSGVFVLVTSSKDLASSSSTRLGWDAVKDDTDFVRMLQSIVAVDKSQQ